jgi:hypothetical protein
MKSKNMSKLSNAELSVVKGGVGVNPAMQYELEQPLGATLPPPPPPPTPDLVYAVS